MIFSYDVSHWATYFVAVLLLNLSPGPDLALTLSHTVRRGRWAGYAVMLGTLIGVVGHTTLAVVGLSALIAASVEAFAIVKWIGVAYLVWIGTQAVRSRGSLLELPADEVRDAGWWAILRQGALVNLLNPKVAIFFLAFLPQFVTPAAGPVWAQLLLHGILIVPVAAMVTVPVVWVGARATRRLRESPKLSAWLDRALGAVLILLGIRLAMIDR